MKTEAPKRLPPPVPPDEFRRDYTAPAFHAETVARLDGDGDYIRTMPRRRVTPLCRPGMAVGLCDQSSETGIIEHCHEEVVIVRGQHGEQIALHYGEIELLGVRPDPAFVVPAPFAPARGKGGRRG